MGHVTRDRGVKGASIGPRGRGYLEQRPGGRRDEQEACTGPGGSQDSGVVGLGCGPGVCGASGHYLKLVEKSSEHFQ